MVKNLYFDMDGVLADLGKSLDCNNMGMMYKKGFFRNLEVIGNPNATFQLLQELGYNVYILSTAVKSKFCKQEKIDWIKEYCPSILEENIIICYTGDNKANFVKTPISESILVDDYKVNLVNWIKAGGKVIKYGRIWKNTRPYPQATDHFQIVPIVESLNSMRG